MGTDIYLEDEPQNAKETVLPVSTVVMEQLTV